jgi:hypothetical protein
MLPLALLTLALAAAPADLTPDDPTPPVKNSARRVVFRVHDETAGKRLGLALEKQFPEARLEPAVDPTLLAALARKAPRTGVELRMLGTTVSIAPGKHSAERILAWVKTQPTVEAGAYLSEPPTRASTQP